MKYIVAVSGGVDSVALLHMLKHNSPHELIVAHVDHGVRGDSDSDVWHVAALASQYGLVFETTRLVTGKQSEEELRRARYAWLRKLRDTHVADGIVTAHHLDDSLETVVLNVGRGTGWRGLASLQTSGSLMRPLLHVPKSEIIQYAITHGLHWREDRTYGSLRYTRNYIRHGVIPKLTATERKKLKTLAEQQRELRRQIEAEVMGVLSEVDTGKGYDRYKLIMMPDAISLEVLRSATNDKCEPSQLRRLLHFVKTGRAGATFQIGNGKNALLTSRTVLL